MRLISKNPIRPLTNQDIVSARNILASRIFLIGVVFRFAIILSTPASIQQDLFLPFIDSHIFPLVDPWSEFLAYGYEHVDAFPYGIVTYFYYKSFTSVVGSLNYIFPFLQSTNLAYLGFNLGTFFLDSLTLLSVNILLGINSLYSKKATLLYWLSPISIYALYVHGQIDILPILLLLLSLIALRFWRFQLSGVLIAAAISCKFSIVICLPFYFIFLKKNHYYNRWFSSIRNGFCVSIASLFVSYAILSEGFREMVLYTPVSLKIFDLKFVQELEPISTNFYLVPFGYLFFVYYFCRLERVNWGLFLCFSSLSLYALAIFVFPSPGWFVWVVPFVVIYITSAEDISSKLYWLSSICYLAYFVYTYGFGLNIPSQANSLTHSILYTAMQSAMILQMVDIYFNGIRSNNFYKCFPTPFLITISGNNQQINENFVFRVSQLLTASNPLRLDMSEYLKFKSTVYKPDIRHTPKLFDRNNVYNYDFSRFLNDLHRVKESLLPSQLNQGSLLSFAYSYSLKNVKFVGSQVPLPFCSNTLVSNIADFNVVIIDENNIDPELNSESIASDIDAVFWLNSNTNSSLKTGNASNHVKMRARLNNFYHQDFVQKQLLATCGLNVAINYPDNMNTLEMCFDGVCSREDLILVLRTSLPTADNLISNIQVLQSGSQGLMQLLIVLSIASRFSLKSTYSQL